MTGLELNSAQRQILLRLIRTEAARANIEIGLALGTEVPTDVSLVELPDEVTSEVWQLRDYRYVVVDGSVLIVSPVNRTIVLVVRS